MQSASILDRNVLMGGIDRASLVDLERRLALFTEKVRELAIDESDESGATRRYVGLLAEAGLLDLLVPGSYGGASESVRAVAVCIARQWLARSSAALDTAFVMQGLGSFPLVLGESSAIAAQVLPKVRRGELITGFALTEPEAGSDIANMRTTATPIGGGKIRLDGHKWFISNAGIADAYAIFVRESQDAENGKAQFSCYWLGANSKGLEIRPQKVIAPHPIGELRLDGVEIDESQRVGPVGAGLRIALGNLDQFRPTVGAAALGLADSALALAIEHLRHRTQFGAPLAKQQGLRFDLAHLAAEHAAAHLLVYRAASMRDEGTATSSDVAMGKYYATESAQRMIDFCVQMHGGRGVLVGETPERLYREIRALRIYEGTSEIQKLVIARSLLDAR